MSGCYTNSKKVEFMQLMEMLVRVEAEDDAGTGFQAVWGKSTVKFL